jgi:hypothetical protein
MERMDSFNNYKKFKSIIFIIFLSVLFCSCKKENPRELCGVWVIDKMTVNGKRFDKFLNVNTISFECKDNSAYFHGSIYFEPDSKAKWEITKIGSQNNLKINSSIKIYNDNFKITVNKKLNGQLHLFLKSNKVDISALKIIENY